MTGDVKDHVEKLLREGERPQAIQYLQDSFKISFEDAHTLVEALEREMGMEADQVEAAIAPTPATIEGSLKTEAAELLNTGRKREGAIGCLQLVARGLGIFLMVVSIFFLAAAGITYFFQSQSISKSDRVEGRVTELRSRDTGESAPVVEYEWEGNKRSYESTYYSSPPDYYVGQSVFVFVNREDPEDITLDTFSGRWGLIVGFALIGGFLLLVSIVFLYFGRRKF